MRIERLNRIATVTLEAGKANAFGVSMLDGLERLVTELDENPPGAVVMTGYSKYFSAGLDLPHLLTQDRKAMEQFMHRFVDVMLRWFTDPRCRARAFRQCRRPGCPVTASAMVRHERVIYGGKIYPAPVEVTPTGSLIARWSQTLGQTGPREPDARYTPFILHKNLTADLNPKAPEVRQT